MSEFEAFTMGMVFGTVFLYGFGTLIYWFLNRRKAPNREVLRQLDAWAEKHKLEQFRRKVERNLDPDEETKQEQVKEAMRRMGLL